MFAMSGREVAGVGPCIWPRLLDTLRFQSSAIPHECEERPSAGWRGSFDGSDCEIPEIQPGDHGDDDFSNPNSGETPCDDTRYRSPAYTYATRIAIRPTIW